MKKSYLCVLVLLFIAASAWAQDAPSIQDGPLATAPAISVPAQLPIQLPDGSYEVAPGITPPSLADAVPAVIQADAAPEQYRGPCMLHVIVGMNGLVDNVLFARCMSGQAAATSATAAVRASKFEPGTLNGQAVPVRIRIRVCFCADEGAPLPVIVHQRADRANQDDSTEAHADPHPILVHSMEPSYSEKARKRKIQGVVTLSTLVNEQGLPTDIRVEKSVGYGLDEKAVEAVSQYTFKPAMRDGKPFATRINIQISFRLY